VVAGAVVFLAAAGAVLAWAVTQAGTSAPETVRSTGSVGTHGHDTATQGASSPTTTGGPPKKHKQPGTTPTTTSGRTTTATTTIPTTTTTPTTTTSGQGPTTATGPS
jgi:hypothetical protein